MGARLVIFTSLLLGALVLSCNNAPIDPAGSGDPSGTNNPDGSGSGALTPDIDKDGIPNSQDRDVDGDGITNAQDPDIDGDGVANADDPDMDGDGVPNAIDSDMDGDGTADAGDADIGGSGTGGSQYTVDRPTTGTSGAVDGSADRLINYGVAQCFWGKNPDGTEMPFVKIVRAVSNGVVDVAVIFHPGFVDNTYGVNTVGWKMPRGHTFRDLVSSDHVALLLKNAAGQTIFDLKLDLLSATTSSSSGYATLGPFGGDGTLTTGNASDILSFGSSLDDNINYYGYELFTDSPKTDSVYTPNPQYPNWEYYAVYRLSVKLSAFGSSGFGGADMTYVHASPAKTPTDTYQVFEKDCPAPGGDDDPFRFRVTFPDEPPDTTTPPPEPPDTTETPPEPPDTTITPIDPDSIPG